jgi:dipeptidyl aminopeptidase/acylaminoacyl peptidase
MKRFAATLAVMSMALTFLPSAVAQDVARVERGSLVMENIPEVPLAMRERLRLYQSARGAGLMDFAPDGRSLLIQTRFGETNQMHRVEQPMGMRRQVSFYDEPVNMAMYRPGRWPQPTILFARDTGGDELYQLYLQNERNGQVTRITDGKSRNTNAVFSRDGKWVAWTSVGSNSSRYRIFVADVNDPKTARVVLEEDGSWSAGDFSPDGLTLAATRDISVSEREIWLIDVMNGRKVQVRPSPVKIFRSAPVFSPDNRSLFYVSDEDSEFRRVVRYDLKTDDEEVLTEDLDFDVDGLQLAPNGRALAFTINDNGYSRLFLMDTKKFRRTPGPRLAPGEIEEFRFSPDSRRLGFTLNGTAGRDVFVWDMGKKAPVQWTDSEMGGLDKSQFVTPELVSYETFDSVDGKRRKVPAFVYRPAGVTGKVPVLVVIHGGPEAQFRPNFNAFIQYMVQELKIAVVAPNVRGSTGYGKYYVELDNGFRRMDSVRDIGATLDWIAAQPAFEPRRVAVYGGSYGGFMSYASMIEYNNRLIAGVSIVGISNFVTFLNNTSGYRRDLRRVEYGDERDAKMREFLQRISPLTNVGRIKRPMLIIQGANDPRVPATEASQMLKAIRSNGAEAWYMLAKDEGHGFQKKSNRDAQNAAIAAFLKLKLVGQRLE